MDLDVLFLGTAGSSPSPRRGLPATLVRRGGDRLLIDCGEGTQRQLMRSVGLVELEELFITHFHADHVLGLPGMLKTFALRQRERRADRVRAARPRAPVQAARSGDRAGAISDRARGARARTTSSSATATGSPPSAWTTAGAALGYALVEDPRPGAVRPRARPRARRRARAGLRPPAARRGGERRPARAGDGRDASRPQARSHRRHRSVRHDPARGLGGRPAGPRGHLHGGRGGARRGDAPLDRRAGGGAGRRGRACRCWRSRTSRRATPAGRCATRRGRGFENVIVPRDFDSVEIPFPERGPPVHIARGPAAAARAGQPELLNSTGGGSGAGGAGLGAGAELGAGLTAGGGEAAGGW